MGLGDTLREARMRMGMSTSEVAAATRMKVQMVDAIEQEDFSDVAAPIYGKGFIKLFAEHVGLDAAPLVQEYVDVHVHHKPRTFGEETREVLMTSEMQAEPEPADSFPEPDEPAPILHQPEVPADDLFAQAAPQAEPPAAEPAPANAPAIFHPEDEPRPGDESPPIDPPPAEPAPPPGEKQEKRMPGAVSLPRINLKKMDLTEAPLKTVGIVIGLVVIVVFLISSVSRLLTRPGNDRGAAGDSLQLAIDPPDPYLE